jgi:L-carnitine CoA-transferase
VRREEIPRAGLLMDVRVVSSGVAIAGPMTAGLLGEFGAEVLHIESPLGQDLLRNQRSTFGLQHRNQRLMTLDIPSPEGRRIFLRLLAEADIWVESSKGGTYARWGLSDEEVWAVNPRLVVVHVSGFGQDGQPEMTGRAGFDAVAQAYSGLMNWNGTPESGPLLARPVMGDHIPALFAAFAAAAALHRARVSGVGESVDVAQYEALLRVQGSMLMHFLNDDVAYPLSGNRNVRWAGTDTFRCGDGRWVFVQLTGRSSWASAVAFFGLAADQDFPPTLNMVERGSATGMRMERLMREYCASRDAGAVETAFTTAGLACSRVMAPADLAEDPHYRARQSLTEWYDESEGAAVRGPNIVPRVRNHPAAIWRAGPRYSADTDDVLAELGYGEGERAALYDKRVALPPPAAETTC